MQTADTSILDQMIAQAQPVKTTVGRLTGEAASAAGRKGMVRDLHAYHGLYRPATDSHPNVFGGITVLGRFRTLAGAGILTSGKHGAEGFYLIRIDAGSDKGAVLAVGAGEFNRYVAGDGTRKASVNKPLSSDFGDVARMPGWGEKLEALGISQTRVG